MPEEEGQDPQQHPEPTPEQTRGESDLPFPTLEQVLDPKSKLTAVNAYRLRQSGPGAPGPIGNPAGIFDSQQESSDATQSDASSSTPTENSQGS